jgi:hypothetical protein
VGSGIEMTLWLDKIRVPGYGITLSASLHLAGEDISGDSSSTARAEKGDKAIELNIGLSIRFDDEKDLRLLKKLAEAKDKNDERTIYNILNQTANVLDVKQVRFDGDVSINEEDSVRAWKVSFKLVEYHSVAEKKQARNKKTLKKKKVMAQSKKATSPIVPIKSDPNDPNALAAFDKVLKGAEEKLK